MGNSKFSYPIRSERFMMEVSIPMTNPSTTVHRIELAEKYFINLRDREVNADLKREYDRGRALVKYADTCGALILLSQYDLSEKRLNIIFTFDSFEGLLDFKNNLIVCVDGATG